MARDERLNAQLEYLRSDDRLRELAELARDMTAEERLEQAWAMSASGAAILAELSEQARNRREQTRDRPAPDAAAVLRRLAGLARPE